MIARSGGILTVALIVLGAQSRAQEFAYVANLNDHTISGFSVNTSTGSLTPIPGSPFAAGNTPWAMAVEPSGTFAYAANVGGNDVTRYRINGSTGALSPVAGSPFPAGTNPMCIANDLAFGWGLASDQAVVGKW